MCGVKDISSDIILIDKPKGITSFDVIRILRNKLKIKKIGHSGTLDPMATGLLIVGIGGGTKKLKEFVGLPKTYIAKILLGISTDTYDIYGHIIKCNKDINVSHEDIRKSIENIVCEKELEVPIFSAKKFKGRKLYEYARNNLPVTPPKKLMTVYSADLLGTYKKNGHTIIKVRFFVSSGTYIRTLAVEIGNFLKVPACLQALRRTKIGRFTVRDAIKLDKVKDTTSSLQA